MKEMALLGLFIRGGSEVSIQVIVQLVPIDFSGSWIRSSQNSSPAVFLYIHLYTHYETTWT